MRTIIVLGAVAALAACNSSDDAALPTTVDNGELFPLGKTVPVTVGVMSADRQPENTVSVSREEATVTLNSIDLDTGAFDVTLTLPDGSSVNLTEASPIFNLIDENILQAFELTDDTGNVVQVAFGFDLRPDDPQDPLEDPSVENTIFGVARVNLEEDPADDPDLNGFNTYVAFGDETETLPTGWASYTGATIATVYRDGNLIDNDFVGHAYIGADFENSEVDVELNGYYSGNSFDYSYALVGEDIPVEGSTYTGVLGIADFGYATSEFTVEDDGVVIETIDLDGDILGAFYGENALATAGVFGATETEHEEVFNEEDVEIVGGFAAYADNAPIR